MTLTDYCDRVVINYDFPTGVEDYVHRIGRTGRAGATGLAYTFFGDQDAKYASELMKVLEGANQRVPPQIRDMASRSGGMGRPRRWDSGYGGRDGGRSGRSDSGYGGRDGGRGGFGMSTSSSGRGGGRGYDYESRNRYDRGRSRSRSPDRGSGRGDRANNLSRDRSRSPPVRRNSPIQSFHQAMMERGRSSPPQKGQHLPAQQSPRHERSRSPYSEAGGRDSHGAARRGWGVSSSSHFGEEEEEGMIRGDGDNMIPHDNGDSYQGPD